MWGAGGRCVFHGRPSQSLAEILDMGLTSPGDYGTIWEMRNCPHFCLPQIRALIGHPGKQERM